MAKTEETKKIQPVIETKVRLTENSTGFQPKAGVYHFVRLDEQGDEIPGSAFEVASAYNAQTYISRPTKFALKKSPTKP